MGRLKNLLKIFLQKFKFDQETPNICLNFRYKLYSTQVCKISNTRSVQNKLKVFVEDVDFGRVFYSRYLQYIERARTELIYEKFGLTLTQLMNEHDIMFVVCNIKYLKSAVFEDNLSVETSVLKKTNVRLNLLQEVKRDAEILVSAEVELAVVDRSGSIKKLTKDFFAKI